MSEPHQKSSVAGRIDHQKVIAALDRADGGGEVGDLRRLVGFDRAALGALDAVMRRQLELNTCAPGPQIKLNIWARGPGAAVLDVMGEGFLPAVKIDGGNALASLEQRHRDVQRCG